MQVRVARHTDRLAEVVAFYRDGLGLRDAGGFVDHDGYDGVFLEIPGTGAHLELTTGGGHRAPDPHPETLLVLYLGDDAAVAPAAATLTANPVSRTALLGWLHGRPWRIAADDGAAEIRDFARAPQFHATLRHATSTWNPSQLSQVGVPIRVCVGSRDLLLGAPNAPRYGAAIPGAQVSWLPGCGHVPMADDPEMIADVIVGGSRPRARARPGSRPGPRT